MQVFVSYRRKSWPFTHRLAESLGILLNATIFVDYKNIDDDDFEPSLLHHLRVSDVVLVVISEYTFDQRIFQPDDWVRREIAEALALDKPMILVSVDGLLPPDQLPEEIVAVAGKQIISFYPEYFHAGVQQLGEFIIRLVPQMRLRSSLPPATRPIQRVSHAISTLDYPAPTRTPSTLPRRRSKARDDLHPRATALKKRLLLFGCGLLALAFCVLLIVVLFGLLDTLRGFA